MNEKEAVKKAFSKSKDAYITSTTHSKGTDLAIIKEWLQPKANMIALDIATGGGHVAKQLSTNVKTVFATDLTKSMLEFTARYLQDRDNIHFLIADAETLPFLDRTFDIVTCRIAAHHFPNPGQFIKEVHRVLKKDGKFLFIDNIAPENDILDTFINDLEKMRDYSHVRSLKRTEWKKLLKQYSFQLKQEQIRKKTLPFVEWVNRTLDHTEDIESVANTLLSATKELQSYFEVEVKNNEITSFAIDEWMVLCTK